MALFTLRDMVLNVDYNHLSCLHRTGQVRYVTILALIVVESQSIN